MKKLLLFALLVLVSCSTKKVVEQIPFQEAAFWKEQEARKVFFSSYRAKIALRYSSSQESVSGTGSLLKLSGQGLRLELRDPLGRTQYVLSENKKQVEVFYPSESVLIEDPTLGKSYFHRTLGFSIGVNQMEKLWTGVLPFSRRNLKVIWNSEEGVYESHVEEGPAKYTLGIDPRKNVLVSLTVEILGTQLKLAYDDFEVVRGQNLAHEVHGTTGKDATIQLEWDTLEAASGLQIPQEMPLSKEGTEVKRIRLK